MRKSKIYNSNQKKAYIDYEAQDNSGINTPKLLRYFTRLAQSEIDFGKDVADMSVEEYRVAIASLEIPSEYSIGICMSMLNGYFEWTKHSGLTDNKAPLSSVPAKSISNDDTVRAKLIESPEELTDILEYAEEFKNRGIQDALAIRLMYLGLTVEQMRYLRKDSINKRGTISVDEYNMIGKYTADKNIIDLWDAYKDMDYLERAKRENQIGFIRQDLTPSNYLFRRVKLKRNNHSAQVDYGFFHMITKKVFARYRNAKRVDKWLSPERIRMSGAFYSLLQMEKDGHKLGHMAFAEAFDLELPKEYSYELLNKRTRKLRTDYQNWKIAFLHE